MLLPHDFIQKQSNAPIIGPVPVAHIVEQLKQEYGAEQASWELVSPHLEQMQAQNAYYYAQDEHLKVTPEEIQVKLLRVPVSDKTRHYTQQDFVRWGSNSDDIFVVYEAQTNYFYCSSSMLHLEIKLAMGLSTSDLEHKTEHYTEYMGLLRRYIETYT